MKKKLLPLFLAGIMICGACAGKGNDSSPSGVSPESQIDEALQSGTDGQGAGQDEQQQPAERIPLVTVENIQLQHWTPDNETLLAEVDWDNITLEGEGYEKAVETVKLRLGFLIILIHALIRLPVWTPVFSA